jgi:protein-S-isoprenylcysteine O-methyltransferase Ste14
MNKIATDDFRAVVFKLRGGIWTLLFLLVWLLAEPPEFGASVAGLSLAATGQAVRFWAAGSIARYRGEQVGAVRLVTWGPYALVRNPLYVGNWFIGAGWGIIAGWKALLLFLLAFWLVYSRWIVPYEEDFLARTFKEEFTDYVLCTGRFLPRIPLSRRISGPFDLSVLWLSERHSFFVTLAGTLVLLFLTF